MSGGRVSYDVEGVRDGHWSFQVVHSPEGEIVTFDDGERTVSFARHEVPVESEAQEPPA
ncbi:hypothetical protein ABII15_14865 [Streptomyces sp. HUAS MG91]|uniref:Uncharacterized protein n=1 Tax=Streptomyces tabacisoli TaxID=3156398 RepID=A0AAU8IRK1_9ACTN